MFYELTITYYQQILYTAVNAVVLGLTQLIPMHYPQFYERDVALSYYKIGPAQVPAWEMYVINFVILACVVMVCSFIVNSVTYSEVSSLSICGISIIKVTYDATLDFHNFIIYAIYAINCPLVTNIVVEILKRVASEARPRAFYDCCYAGFCDAVSGGNWTTYLDNTDPNALGDLAKCQGVSEAEKRDCFMSWPSGHAATSFSCMMACVYIIQMTCKMYKNDVLKSGYGLCPYCLLIIAGWISVTRVQDYEHHQADIFCGAFIGMVVSSLLYWVYTPIQVVRNEETGEVTAIV